MAGDVWRIAGRVADLELAEIARPATRGAVDDVGRSIISVEICRIVELIASRSERRLGNQR
jgi:hypothetical protein